MRLTCAECGRKIDKERADARMRARKPSPCGHDWMQYSHPKPRVEPSLTSDRRHGSPSRAEQRAALIALIIVIALVIWLMILAGSDLRF